MKRSKILELLQAYIPSPAEVLNKKEMITFIENNQDCFERSLAAGHLTASAWLLNKDTSQVLLTHHTKLNMWLQLGGHCDGDPDILGVAIKEAQEESGITQIYPVSEDIFDIDIHLIPAYKQDTAHYHYDVRFLLQVTSDEKIRMSKESKELRWVDRDIKNFPTNSPSMLRMFHKWKRQLSIPEEK